ncbi:Apoptotic ATPase [Handroanthus impetiginosus]|uniref:Apoptotic ATPase n=1 Tax=Handroanthus impetiginosus TaxID=429701 RepID=A0A2G9H1W8_9LAMI|nr:Apoptotic ATPase [Handroanthus impetiginosus]
MAEAAVAIVINKAIAAKALLEGEGLHSQEHISWIETQTKTLQSYLKDAQSKKEADFINSIRDFALDVEDSLDTFVPEIEQQKSKGSFGFLKHPSCIPCYGVTDNDFSLKIEEFKKRAAKIEQSKGDIAAESSVDMKFWVKTKEFKKTYFLREERGEIKAKISGGDQKCRMIYIIGPGGVGKTTLAREIYDQVKKEFECSAMVCISEESPVGDLLIDIARQVKLGESKMKQNLQENLNLFLRDRKYVIFLDDFLHKFDVLTDVVMTNSKKGSRIIVTCREQEFQELACYLDDSIHEKDSITLKHLSDSEGKKLFHDCMGQTLSSELENISDKIVRKCGGLPLAIHVAAGLLKAKERSERSWNEVLERMDEGNENDNFNRIFNLSYQDLPTKLKPFFLYFGIFPMNREIFVSELIRLWVAEKLVIKADESRKPNRIVEDYMDELIERNLIQVSRTRVDGRVKSCGIQNLLRDFCIGKAKEINFFYNSSNLRNDDLPSTARRVIADSSSTNSTIPGKLRAVLCFSKGEELANFIQRHASELRFLQLLSIEVDYKAINIPVEILDFSGLTYLKIKGRFITIPSSIWKLKRLQTLEVRSREVPESILKMKHLVHLFVSGVIIPKSKTRKQGDILEVDLQNLETLYFDYQYGYHLSPNSFKRLPSLKKLRLSISKTITLEAFCGTTPLLQKLEDLKLRVGRESHIPSSMDFSGCKNLQTLYLVFNNSNISCSFEFPKTLVRITLGGIGTEDKDPVEKLKKLPSLEIIKLKNCTAEKIDLSGNGNFPRLKILMLCDTKFQLLAVDEHGMPNLNKFMYRPHPQQPLNTEVPEKLKRVQVEMDDLGFIRSSTRDIKVV